MEKMKETKFCRTVSKVWNNKFFRIVWVRLGLLSLLLNLVIEILSRHSIWKGFVYFAQHPLAFVLNSLMIFFTLSFAAFFKKRIFVTIIISIVWFVLGIVNFVIRGYRKTPFTAPDILNTIEGLKIIDQYMSLFQIILLIILIIALMAAIVFFGIKSPKIKGTINYMKTGLITAVSFGIIALSNQIGNATGLLPKNFGNIVKAYDTYGFGYCFSCSLLRSGIDKPKDYSGELVDDVMGEVESGVDDAINNNAEIDPDKDGKPNIIFVQLESLFDPTLVNGLEFSEDPIPNLRKLYSEYSCGYLSVPSFGAGTANTEFEVITGMNLDDFGPGEYPYKTILRNTACESVCYYLKEYGYVTSAIHDNEGDFYTRHTVFSRLGFDYFVPIEYMGDITRNPTGWPKDECLIEEILGVMDASKDKSDFIYTISVQGHGDYPEDTSDIDIPLKVTNNYVTGNADGFEYYVNQVHEMDEFVGNLIKALEERDEKTVLVLYGDHLPTFDIEDDDLANGDIYQTQYVIWDNFDMEKNDKDIQAYQLTSVILGRLGIVGGNISKLHLSCMDKVDEEEYLYYLKLLEYDLLYGNCEAYEGVNPYQITNMKMGYKNIRITSADNVYSHISVKGENFTEYSHVVINGYRYNTIYNGPNELLVADCQLEEGDEIVVVQRTVNDNELSGTSIYVYQEKEDKK